MVSLRSSARYHEKTSHVRNRIPPHFLDYKHHPHPFKSYEYLKKIAFEAPDSFPLISINPVLDGCPEDAAPGVTATGLARALLMGYGVTLARPGQGIWFRSVPSAGGLYPCQVYLSVDRSRDLETGVYYCDTVQGFFGKIAGRPLDMVSVLGREVRPSIHLVVTGIYFNSAWKYRERAFRYLLLDGGHLCEGLMNGFTAVGFSPTLCYDFDDEKAALGLNLDIKGEVPLAVVALESSGETGKTDDRVRKADTQSPRFAREVLGPAGPPAHGLMQAAYALGSVVAEPPDTLFPSKNFSDVPEGFRDLPRQIKKFPSRPFVEILQNRRSRRNFVKACMPEAQWSQLLERVFQGIFYGHNAGEPAAKAASFLRIAFVCQNLENLPDGVYSVAADFSSVACRIHGNRSRELSRVCLDQEWIAMAGITVLFIADFKAMEAVFGARGYRYALLNAGRAAQRIYLAAQALDLGCCGIGALYDFEAGELLGLESDSALFYAVSAGPVKKMIRPEPSPLINSGNQQ